MLSVNLVKVVLNVKSLLSVCILTSHILWLVEAHFDGDGLRAFRKLLQKNTNDSGIHKVTLQASSLFVEKKMLTSTLPIEAQATPALPGISTSELPKVLQNIVVISDHKQEDSTSVVEQKISSDVSVLNEPAVTDVLNNQSIPLENASAVNETANATVASTEVDQASGESEVMPSFDEWKRRMLAEQSIKGDNVAQPPSLPPKKISGQKRRRNYASYECGAKVVASNAESESTGRILNEQMDEYMLNPCNAHIWFVIELCETIQVAQIELANFELFSSMPKDITIYWSDRFPTREWTSLGGFIAQDHRTLQSFTLQQQGYGKFMKIEMLSHYGTEHYCPLSVVRVYGTSMVDEYEEMETVHHPSEDEEDRLDIPSYDGKDASSKDLFGSAKEAVYNMVRKAAQALTRENEGSVGNQTDVPVAVSQFVTDISDAEAPSISKKSLYQHLLMCGMCCSMNKTVFPMNSYCGFMQSLLSAKDLQMQCNLQICQCLANNYPVERDHFESNITMPVANASEPVVDQTDYNTTTTQESLCTTTTDPAASLFLVTPSAPPTHPLLQPSVEETQETPPVIDLVQETIHPSPSVSQIPDEFLKNESWEAEPKHFTNGVTPGQKESVFVRLNNRIRGLETNLSLSTQYLQELSQRYRRQMEDMQRVFNRTVGVLNDTAHRAAEKDARQQETIQELQEKVVSLTRSSDIMMAERHAIYRQVYEAHLFLIVTEVIVMVTVLSLCLRRFTVTATSRKSIPAPLYSSPLKRHNSISHMHSTPVGEKKRRPSGEVSSAGSYAHLMIVEPAVPIFVEPAPPKAKKKHRNKKPRNLQRSISNPNLATFSSSHTNIENIPRSLFGARPPSQNTGPIPFQNLTNGILELPVVKLPKDNCLLNK